MVLHTNCCDGGKSFFSSSGIHAERLIRLKSVCARLLVPIGSSVPKLQEEKQ